MGRTRRTKPVEFTTTVEMTLEQRAGLDQLKNARHLATGKRPTQSELICEGLQMLLDKELKGK